MEAEIVDHHGEVINRLQNYWPTQVFLQAVV